MRVREATPEDASAVAVVHRRAILELGRRAYSEAQVDAWSGDGDSADAELDLEGRRFVVAEREARAERAPRRGSGDRGEPRAETDAGETSVVGFGSLEPTRRARSPTRWTWR